MLQVNQIKEKFGDMTRANRQIPVIIRFDNLSWSMTSSVRYLKVILKVGLSVPNIFLYCFSFIKLVVSHLFLKVVPKKKSKNRRSKIFLNLRLKFHVHTASICWSAQTFWCFPSNNQVLSATVKMTGY